MLQASFLIRLETYIQLDTNKRMKTVQTQRPCVPNVTIGQVRRVNMRARAREREHTL